jgi:hypothetical protein
MEWSRMSHEAWPGNEEQKVILGGVLREATKGKDAWGMPEGRPRGHVTGRGTWGSMELGGVLGEATKGHVTLERDMGIT